MFRIIASIAGTGYLEAILDYHLSASAPRIFGTGFLGWQTAINYSLVIRAICGPLLIVYVTGTACALLLFIT